MKRYLTLIIALLSIFIGVNASAQTRTKISDGVYLVRYGNTAVIEDENSQRSISLSVEKHEDNYGQIVYDIFCGNKYTKGIAKTALKGAIAAALTSAGSALGGPGGATLGATISAYANSIASNIYDDVCSYYGERR